jgi:hypothetical protein
MSRLWKATSKCGSYADARRPSNANPDRLTYARYYTIASRFTALATLMAMMKPRCVGIPHYEPRSVAMIGVVTSPKAPDGGYAFFDKNAVRAFFDCLPNSSFSASVQRRSGAMSPDGLIPLANKAAVGVLETIRPLT